MLNTLAQARLITLGADNAEVAHEALIREWPQLREWLNQDREGLRLHRQLTEAAQEWEFLDHDTGALYRGVRLAQAQEFAANNPNVLNVQERAFLDASVDNEKKEAREKEEQQERELRTAQKLAETQTRAAKQLRQRAYILVGALVLALLLAGLALFFGNRANENAAAGCIKRTRRRARAGNRRIKRGCRAKIGSKCHRAAKNCHRTRTRRERDRKLGL